MDPVTAAILTFTIVHYGVAWPVAYAWLNGGLAGPKIGSPESEEARKVSRLKADNAKFAAYLRSVGDEEAAKLYE